MKKQKTFVFSVSQAIVVLDKGFTELTIQEIIEKIGKIDELNMVERTSSDKITLHTKLGDEPRTWTSVRAKVNKIIATQPMIPDPKVGDKLYVPTTDDNNCGWAIISKIKPGVSAGKTVDFVCFEGSSRLSFNLQYLLQEQKRLKRDYGKHKAFFS